VRRVLSSEGESEDSVQELTVRRGFSSEGEGKEGIQFRS
jgi:hypothetical protein